MKTTLRRDLNLLAAVGVGSGAIIGAGIFVVTGVAAGVAGAAFLIGLFVAGLAHVHPVHAVPDRGSF